MPGTQSPLASPPRHTKITLRSSTPTICAGGRPLAPTAFQVNHATVLRGGAESEPVEEAEMVGVTEGVPEGECGAGVGDAEGMPAEAGITPTVA